MQKIYEKSAILSAAVLGFILLIPLIILEVVNRARFNEGFPFAVFIFTWVLQAFFVFLLVPIIKNWRVGQAAKAKRTDILLRVITLITIAYIWGGWIVDQWPCLMGVPNCD